MSDQSLHLPDAPPTVSSAGSTRSSTGAESQHDPNKQAADPTPTPFGGEPQSLAGEKAAGGWNLRTKPVGGDPGPRDTSSTR